jgi:hypothetical protein
MFPTGPAETPVIGTVVSQQSQQAEGSQSFVLDKTRTGLE